MMRSAATAKPGDRWRAPYGSDPAAARPRLHPEPASPTRTAFQRDRDRILHSAAFRRLTHKTQVFVHHEGDHFRTRLTHTLEVSQIARALARSFGLDEDLSEALALAHDLGHTPFGHTGEDALSAAMSPFGGFDHNAQALRIVTRLERRYAAFDGLNLTADTLEGLVKHNGPVVDEAGRPNPRHQAHGLPGIVVEIDRAQPLALSLWGAGEAQAAAIADDVAYDAHDIDDGLRAGIFPLDALREVPFLAGLLAEVDGLGAGLEPSRQVHELTRRVITRMVEDIVAEGGRRLAALAPEGPDDIRRAGAATIRFSDAMAEADSDIKAFLFRHLYRHPRLLTVRAEAEGVVRDLFGCLAAEPGLMPEEWRRDLDRADEARVARRVADYIAGMTDRYALAEHRRLFASTPRLRLGEGGTG